MQNKKLILKFKLLSKNAKIPIYNHVDDAGFGIFSIEEKILKPNEYYPVSTGISSEIPKNHFVSIRDRSSMGVKGLHLLGGVIDAGYRGEWKIILINLSNENYKIEIGDKIAQGILQESNQVEIMESNELSKTKRGVDGFGSTGK